MSRWYIIHAYSGFENKVKDAILSEATRLGLETQVEAVEVHVVQLKAPADVVVEQRQLDAQLAQGKLDVGAGAPAAARALGLGCFADHILRNTYYQSSICYAKDMAKQFEYSFVFKAGNAVQRGLLALGISLNGTTLITVAGRKTGRPHSTPITMIELDGQRYLQSPFGNVNWVRNLRAAGTATLSWGRRHETITATELSPEQAAPVIKSMLGHAPKLIQEYFDVTPASSLEEFIHDAPNHAVFAVHPAA